MGYIVRDSRKDRRHDQPDRDAGVGESLERPEPDRRHRGARLDLPDERDVHRVEGDVNLEIASLVKGAAARRCRER